MAGMPKQIRVFDFRAKEAGYVEIHTWYGMGLASKGSSIVLTKNKDGIWCSPLWRTEDGYMRYELIPKQVNYSLERVPLSEEEGNALIEALVPAVTKAAEEVINWCDEKDKEDEDGRYWLSAYRGAGVYRLIVAEGKIQGAIYGGLHDNDAFSVQKKVGDIVFLTALKQVIENRLNTKDFHLLKADGSGTYFYLRYQEDAAYLHTKKYDVPDAKGGLHHNIEVK